VSSDELNLLKSRSTNRHPIDRKGATGHYVRFYITDESDLQVLQDLISGRIGGMVARRKPTPVVAPRRQESAPLTPSTAALSPADRTALDDNLLEAFMQQFYGYGSYAGRFWLVGMEEGGGATRREIAARLQTWQARGGRELEDLTEFSEAAVSHKWFGDRPALQSTWSKLIRLLLAVQGMSPSTDQIRAYQGRSLGRLNSDHCLLELLPLPSPSIGEWLYGQFSSLDYLANRQSYTGHVQGSRIVHLQRRMDEHRPRAVIFYGLKNFSAWQQIARTPLEATTESAIYTARQGGSVYMAIKGPTSRGLSNDYLDQAGRILGQMLT